MIKNPLKNIFIPVLIFLFHPCWAQNQDVKVLPNLDSTLNLALKTNFNYQVYKQQARQALYNLRSSRSTLLPTISGVLNGQDNTHLAITPIPGVLIGKPGTTYNAQFGTKYNYNTGLTLQKDLLSWQNFQQIKLAEGNLKLIQVEAEAYKQSLKEQVAKLYFSILIAKQSLALDDIDKGIADTLVELSFKRLNLGSSDAISFNQSQINYNTVLQNIAQSRQLYDQGIENLKILLGTQVQTDLQLDENLGPESVYLISEITLSPDKNLETYKQNYQIAQIQSNIQKSLFFPKLSFITYLGANQYRNDLGFSLNSANWNKTAYLGLNLSVPIFTGLATLNKYRSAKVQTEIAATQYQSALNQSTINDQLLLKNDRDLRASLNASKQGYDLYARNLELYKQKFQEGITNLDVYLKAFQDYINAENLYLNNLSNFLSNKASILARK